MKENQQHLTILGNKNKKIKAVEFDGEMGTIVIWRWQFLTWKKIQECKFIEFKQGSVSIENGRKVITW